MFPILDTVPTTYVCAITYSSAGISGANIASHTFSPALPPAGVNPGDVISFTFSPAIGTMAGKLDQAVLIAGYKDANVSMESSPFYNDANNIDIHSFPKLIIGSRSGTWGFTVAFSMIDPAAGSAKATTHFYFLPDPIIEVRPN
jgi:hypothetical protein